MQTVKRLEISLLPLSCAYGHTGIMSRRDEVTNDVMRVSGGLLASPGKLGDELRYENVQYRCQTFVRAFSSFKTVLSNRPETTRPTRQIVPYLP